jgi:hypothetical protein
MCVDTTPGGICSLYRVKVHGAVHDHTTIGRLCCVFGHTAVCLFALVRLRVLRGKKQQEIGGLEEIAQ